jgi:hypothetical protein
MTNQDKRSPVQDVNKVRSEQECTGFTSALFSATSCPLPAFINAETLCIPAYCAGISIITPWPQSASELYRQNGRRRSAKVVPTVSG